MRGTAKLASDRLVANEPDMWREALPTPAADAHKYARGHALVVSGPEFGTGASRLSARGALRIGAGLVTVAGERAALRVHAAHVTAIMLAVAEDACSLGALLDDERFTAALIGPGAGRDATLRARVAAVARKRPLVLDADALWCFAGDVDALAALVRKNDAPVVLTPHEGEFARLVEGTAIGKAADKPARARALAERTGTVVVLKGPGTAVASPDGRVSVARNGPPTLATAGTGDVLAGMVCGLLAQNMPAFEAASAAVWLHGDAARRFGPGLIAEDLPDLMPGALAALAG